MMDLQEIMSATPFAFGGAAISGEGGGYGFGAISQNESIDLLNEAFENGVKIFDSAPIYGFGLSEKRIGMAFKQKREKVFIISKSGVSWHPDSKRVNMTNNPLITKSMLEQSLRDLGSDYIDLYMIHWPDKDVDIRRPLEVLFKAKQEGKIKHIGLCNTHMSDLLLGEEIGEIEVVQSELNLFNDTIVTSLFSYFAEKKISFMSWGTLDKGIISGRVNQKRKFEKEDCRSWAPWWKDSDLTTKYKVMDNLRPFLEENAISGLELALGFNLSFPEVSSVLCGARNKEQLHSIFKALKNLPSKEILEEAVKIKTKYMRP